MKQTLGHALAGCAQRCGGPHEHTRLFMLTLFGIALISASLFVVENEVRNLRGDLKEINRQITADKEAIHIMEAEWAYLSQPGRIALLTEKHLPELKPLESSQFVSLEHVGKALAQNKRSKKLAYARSR